MKIRLRCFMVFVYDVWRFLRYAGTPRAQRLVDEHVAEKNSVGNSCGEIGREEYFAGPRRSVRQFEGDVEVARIRAAVAAAGMAPSACNRQHWRVHCVGDHTMRDEILSMQHGGSFAKSADKILVVTFDLGLLNDYNERNDGFLNAGIFLMELCNALHHEKIAHCILNWHIYPRTDMKLKALVGIPVNETPVALVACGGAPERVWLCPARRKNVDEILRIV